MTVWRLSRAMYQDLSGAGGLRFKGRWNDVGFPVVYTSGSLALSVLERRVHSLERPKDDVALEIELPDDGIEMLDPLPNGWKDDLASTRRIGTDWLKSNRSLVLRVPSAVIPAFNYLLNPRHKGISRVKIVSITPFEYDKRLFQA